MARPKKGTASKKSLVIDLLGKGLSNKEVVEAAKRDHKVTISPTYVSIVKSHAKRSRNGVARKRGGRKSESSLATINAAVEFIRTAGSVEAARKALATVEEIRQLA